MDAAALGSLSHRFLAATLCRRDAIARALTATAGWSALADLAAAKRNKGKKGNNGNKDKNNNNKRKQPNKRKRRDNDQSGSGSDGSFASPNPGADFVAFYTKLDSGAEWERSFRAGSFADIWVNLGQDQRLVFWRASSYLPRWETGQGTAYLDLVLPRDGDGQDRRWDVFCRHSYVRLIASSPTEILVHWRYAPRFETRQRPQNPSWTGWVDEYFTVRPDRTVTRTVYDYDAGTAHTFQLVLHPDGTVETVASGSAPFTRPAPASNSALALPTGPDREFGAAYTNLGYSGPWHRENTPCEVWNDCWQVGEHPDVVVDFDGSANKWVFWRGTNFVALMVTENGVWYTNEFNETWDRDHMETDGAEPMSDKQNRYAHVRVIENTPARAVVHYRYALVDNFYNLVWRNGSPFGWGDWADFYYYLYPDGAAVQKNTIWSNGATNGDAHEFQETIIVHSPGRTPTDNIETAKTVTLANLSGKSRSYNWTRKRYDSTFKKVPKGANIQLIHLQGTDFNAFTVVAPGKGTFIRPYDGSISKQVKGVFRWRNHWPVNMRNVFGNDAKDASEPTHTSLTHMFWPFHAKGNRQATKILLMGLSDKPVADIARLGRSWHNAPSLGALSANVQKAGYDPAQRAYVIDYANPDDAQEISFVVNASSASPLVNACFVVRDWRSEATAQVTLDGSPVAAAQGLVRDTDGKPSLVVWVEHESSQPVAVAIQQGQ